MSRVRACAVALLTAALGLQACSARSHAVPRPSAPAAAAVPLNAGPEPNPGRGAGSAASLTARLASLFTAAELEHAHIGVLVRSLLTGETLYALNDQQLFVPASNQKLLTVAAAARRLGWDFRYTTRIVATGPVKPDGTLDGHLVVVGGGDPTINPRHPERWRMLDEWAAEIAARGVRVVGGHLVGDDNAFAEPGWGSGWSWDDLVADYGSPVGALQYHENEAELLIGPGMEIGRPAILSTAPLGHGLLIDNRVVTGPADEPTQITVDRPPGTILLNVRGRIAIGSPARRRAVAVDNPTTLLLTAFREALGRKGIFVAGSVADIDELRESPYGRTEDLTRSERHGSAAEDAHVETWIVDRSAPLYEIADPLLKWSRNGYAETLLWSLSPEGAPASEAAGLAVLRDELAAMHVEPPLFAAFDGSGLSRYDMISPEALVRVLRAMWDDPALIGPFREALPVAGRSGSLANQLNGTAAEGRVWAKSGSMFNIRSISGYVLTADNEPIAFSFLANNYLVPSARVEATYDKALERLAAFRR